MVCFFQNKDSQLGELIFEVRKSILDILWISSSGYMYNLNAIKCSPQIFTKAIIVVLTHFVIAGVSLIINESIVMKSAIAKKQEMAKRDFNATQIQPLAKSLWNSTFPLYITSDSFDLSENRPIARFWMGRRGCYLWECGLFHISTANITSAKPVCSENFEKCDWG